MREAGDIADPPWVGGSYVPCFRRQHFDSISTRDWCAILRFYRILRIRIPHAAVGSPEMDGLRSSGLSYGMSREDAKRTLWEWTKEIDWHEYLASK